MRRLGARALASAIVTMVAAGAASGPGCSANKPTELVPGVLTQVQVPRDLQAIRVDVEANGKPAFCQSYIVYDGTVRLPRTLGVVSATSPQTTVKVTIRGYDASGASGQDISDCSSQQPVGSTQGPGPRTLRR
jgi:hypothetical protein